MDDHNCCTGLAVTTLMWPCEATPLGKLGSSVYSNDHPVLPTSFTEGFLHVFKEEDRACKRGGGMSRDAGIKLLESPRQNCVPIQDTSIT